MIIDNYTINIKLLKFNDIIENEFCKYSIITYNNHNLQIKIKSIKFISCFYNQSKDMFVLKFNLNNSKFIDFMSFLEKNTKKYIINKKNTVFNKKFSNNEIKNLYFSNIETSNDIKILNTKTSSLNTIIDSGNELNINEKYNIIIEISGVWIYESLYGLSLELISIEK